MKYLAFLPEVIVGLLALACLAAGPAGPVRLGSRGRRAVPVWVSVGLLLALLLELTLGATVFGGPYVQDRLALFGKGATLLALLLAVAVTDWDLEGVAALGWRPLGVTLVGALGVMAVASAAGYAGLWIGLALALLAPAFSVALGEPAALRGRLLTSAAGSLLLTLAGLLVIFVATGQAGFASTAHSLSGHVAPISVAIGVLLVAGGLGVALVAAPWGLAARRSVSPFALGAGFGLVALGAGLGLVKVTGAAVVSFPGWAPGLQLAAAVAIVAGAFGALSASRLSRLLGWVGVVQVGWFLAALSTHQRAGIGGGLFALAALAVAGAVAPQLIAASESGLGLPGLGARQPWRAAALIGSLLSLAGAPPLVGFFAEFAIGSSLARSGGFWVLAVGLMATILTLAATVRVIRRLFLDGSSEELRRPVPAEVTLPALAVTGAWVTAVMMAGWGLLANPTFDLAVQGAAAVGFR